MARKSKWPDRAVDRVTATVEEFNGRVGERQRIHIVWGYANKDDEREEASMPPGFEQPEALLSYLGTDYTLLLAASGDPGAPDKLTISTAFPVEEGEGADDALLLPADDPRRLYNLLAVCRSPVQLDLIPDMVSDEPRIIVVGCSVTLPVEGLSPRILRAALRDLRSATALACDQLARNQGDDYWGLDGGP